MTVTLTTTRPVTSFDMDALLGRVDDYNASDDRSTSWVSIDTDEEALPSHLDPVIGAFINKWFRELGGDAFQDLLLDGDLSQAHDTRDTVARTRRRAVAVFDWMTRTYLPTWLDAAKIPNTLGKHPRISSVAGMRAMRPMLCAIRSTCADLQADTGVMATVLAYRYGVRPTGASAAQAAVTAAHEHLGFVAGTTTGGRPQASGGTMLSDIVLAATHAAACMIHQNDLCQDYDCDVRALMAPYTTALQTSADRMLVSLCSGQRF